MNQESLNSSIPLYSTTNLHKSILNWQEYTCMYKLKICKPHRVQICKPHEWASINYHMLAVLAILSMRCLRLGICHASLELDVFKSKQDFPTSSPGDPM